MAGQSSQQLEPSAGIALGQPAPVVRRTPGEMLLSLCDLSVHHSSEAAEVFESGIGTLKSARFSEPGTASLTHQARLDNKSKASSSGNKAPRARKEWVLDPIDLDPIEAAAAATASAARGGGGSHVDHRGGSAAGSGSGANGPGRRRRGGGPRGPLPRHCDVARGWSELLGEIAASSRRVRSARGGVFTAAGVEVAASDSGNESDGHLSEARGSAPATPTMSPANHPSSILSPSSPSLPTGAASPSAHREGEESPRSHKTEEAADNKIWLSYRICAENVPDSVLTTLWRQAVDPKHFSGPEVQPLDKVPRLTVTKREVQQLPAVHDIHYWRQANKRRREQRKARRDAERYPSLEEMFVTLFGDPQPGTISTAEAAFRQQAAAAATAALVAELKSSKAGSQLSALQRQAMEEELELLREVERLLKMETEEARYSESKVAAHLSAGTLHRSRRGAFDEGRASAKAAELQRREKGVVKSSRLLKAVEASRAAAAAVQADDQYVESLDQDNLRKVTEAISFVTDRCEIRAQKMHDDFLRRQGKLSERLQRRVKRIQIDHDEIRDMKVRSILPSTVTAPSDGKPGDKTQTYASVLHYLKPHRYAVERDRQGKHSIYLRQVERFESHLRRLADPNRQPERGETYISQCFRHVLSAGLIVDNAYFFRVLSEMEPEDFEKAPTVNFVVACCDAFEVRARDYISFLNEWGFACMVPRPRRQAASILEDGAPWDGVVLSPLQLHASEDKAATNNKKHV
ncbi:unnamed protein product [Polarella glacialis]|uniref:Uncharacterized protein n=1 Tax=Polarella glacialis TaxID=89957 RepID=A0A813J9P5_POLGL|nr:unnamed protein product [Polarella glacialis]